MYREWKKIGFPKIIIYEFGNNKIHRQTKERYGKMR